MTEEEKKNPCTLCFNYRSAQSHSWRSNVRLDDVIKLFSFWISCHRSNSSTLHYLPTLHFSERFCTPNGILSTWYLYTHIHIFICTCTWFVGKLVKKFNGSVFSGRRTWRKRSSAIRGSCTTTRESSRETSPENSRFTKTASSTTP